mgnify:CR=1 FL=1
MRIIDMLNSSRQMMFENAVSGFEYTARGTCFLCRYAGIDYGITAKHVVDDYSADDVRILFHQEAREFAPHNAQLTIKIPDTEDTDWADLAFYPLERSQYQDRQFAEQLPYLIPGSSHIWQPGLKGHFILRGFPHDLNAIDYEAAIIGQQAVILEADYFGQSPMAHCHEIQFRDISMCRTLDGLSGTPVFWLGEAAPYEHRFAGLLLRATHTSGRGHFVHAEVILAALDKAMEAK